MLKEQRQLRESCQSICPVLSCRMRHVAQSLLMFSKRSKKFSVVAWHFNTLVLGRESHDCSCQLSAYLIETQGHLWLGSTQLCGYRRIRCERRANQLLQVWTVCHHSIQRLRSWGSGASASFGVMCRQMCRDVDPKPPWSRCGSVCQQNVSPKRCRPK